MVVFIIDAFSILPSKTERDAPVAADLDGPGGLPSTLQLVKFQARQIQVAGVSRGMQPAENQSESVGMLRLDPTLVAGGEEAFEPFVPKALDRHKNKCNLCGYE